jgi:hypothetical protein
MHFKFIKIHFSKVAISGHKTRQVGWQGRQAWSINVPTLTDNIFAGGTNWTSIHNKTSDTCHLSVYFNEMSMDHLYWYHINQGGLGK